MKYGQHTQRNPIANNYVKRHQNIVQTPTQVEEYNSDIADDQQADRMPQIDMNRTLGGWLIL